MSGVSDPPLGAVLAGGRGVRMGADKPLVELAGTPLAVRVARALEAAGCDPVLIGRGNVLGLTGLADAHPAGRGPAAGLATALRHGGERDVVLVGADQPFLAPDTVRGLLATAGEAVVPLDGGMPQTTCAVYRSACLEPVEHLLGRGGSSSLQRLIGLVAVTMVDAPGWAAWGEDGRSWWSLDTPEEVAAAERWMAAGEKRAAAPWAQPQGRSGARGPARRVSQ